MKEKRYMEDWVNRTHIDDRGREKRTPEYRGDWYSWGTDSGAFRRKALLGCVLSMALIIVYFLLDFPGGRMLYVFLPLGLALFPGMYWGMGVWSVFHAPNPMTRLQKEKGLSRVLRCSAAVMILMLAAAVGEIVFMVRDGKAALEWPGLLLIAAAGLAAAYTMLAAREAQNSLTVRRHEDS